MNDDGTVRVDDRIVHLTPSAEADAFADERVKRVAVEEAAQAGDRQLALRLARLPVLAPDDQTIRVCFVTPDTSDDADILQVLGDLAWAEDGRQVPWLSEVTYVVDDRIVRGARLPFASGEDRTSAAELVATVEGLSAQQRRRLLRRISDTPILART